MMLFDEFVVEYLIPMARTERLSKKEAGYLCLGYFILSNDPVEQAKAKAYIEDLVANQESKK